MPTPLKRKRDGDIVPYWFALRVRIINNGLPVKIFRWLDSASESYVAAEETARCLHWHCLFHSKKSLDSLRKSIARALRTEVSESNDVDRSIQNEGTGLGLCSFSDGSADAGNKLYSLKSAHTSLDSAHAYTVKQGNVKHWKGMQFTPDMNAKAKERSDKLRASKGILGEAHGEGSLPWQKIVQRCTLSEVNPQYHELAYAGICLDVFKEYKPTTESYQLSQSRYAKLMLLEKNSGGWHEMVESFARKLR